MRNRYIEAFEKAQIGEKNIPDFHAGDTIKLGIRIKEGDKSRIQNFEGVCISVRGEGAGKTFTVRKIGANNVGVERIFPLYAESLESVELIRRGDVRRSKLYYLRNLRGKAARIKEAQTLRRGESDQTFSVLT
ncbi:MAG: 50S ribosomal protein L19 [Helicobacteraceae bacterium]|nr:50S ribosomal protein L19 [Helicobacteraceae bacterium]